MTVSGALQTAQLDVTLVFSTLAVLGWDVVQDQIPAVDFVRKYEHVFAFK